MAGHSKWANIKHRKAKGDAQRAKIFTKIGRELAVAVKQGGPDPEVNSRLKDAIAKAKANNMPGDNIQRAIKKAAGELSSVNYEPITYEGYGISGAAVMVECLTDNKNRTAGDIRHYFDKYGGSLGAQNCVSFMFDKKGVVTIERSAGISEDQLFEDALEAGADDMETDGDVFVIYCDPASLAQVKGSMEKKYAILEAEIDYIPQTTVKLEGENLEKFLKMIDCFEDLDDVQNVYHNVELPEEAE